MCRLATRETPKPVRHASIISRGATLTCPDRAAMGNVNAANLKPEEIEEFSLMSNCTPAPLLICTATTVGADLTQMQSPSWS